MASRPLHADGLAGFANRHVVELVTALYLLPLLWGGLVPFDFTPSTHLPAGAAIVWGLPRVATHTADLAGNVAVYIPLGALLTALLRKRGWAPLLAVAGATGFAAVFSYGTEWTQIYSPSRVSSLADWKCNMAGALCGAIAHRLIGRMVRTWALTGLRLLQESVLERPSGVAAAVWAAFLFLAAVAPLDVTFSVDRLRQSLVDANFVPLARAAKLSDVIDAGMAADPTLTGYVIRRDAWQLGLDYACRAAGYALLAVLLRRYLNRHCRVGSPRDTLWIMWSCFWLAVFSSLAQLFIISRTCDVTDVLVALVGALAGLAGASAVARFWQPERPLFGLVQPVTTRRRLVHMLLAGWAVVLVARALVPFWPNFSPGAIARQVREAEWIPLQDYQRTRLPIALDDLVTKAGGFALLGVLVSAATVATGRPRRAAEGLRTGLTVAAAAAILEVLQVFLPSRTPSLGDCLLAGGGAACGVGAFRLWESYVRGLAAGRTVAGEVVYDVVFGDEFPAPQEQVPEPKPSPAPEG